MDLGIIVALASLLLTGVVIAAVVGGAWALGRQHERNFRERGSAGTEARLERMERMLETLSTDVERLAEDRRPLIGRSG
jgi:hypothetical protein